MKFKDYIALCASLFLNIILGIIIYQLISKEPEIVRQPVEVAVNKKLTDWELFTLALVKVESGYKSDVVSEAGATGYFQMTPIYVKEVNRVHGTDYSFEQVKDFKTANEIFKLMQDAHNPEYEIDRAIELHNGKKNWYKKRIYKAMEDIAKYEEIRDLVINN